MKRTINTLLLAIAGLALTGCSTFSFLYPLANDPQDLASDIDLSGTWKDADKDRWLFEKHPDGTYQLTWSNEKESMVVEASVVRISNHLFLDAATSNEAIRGHAFARITLEGDKLQLAWLNSKWLEKKLTAERALSYETPGRGKDKRYVITAHTRDLQNFLMRHASDPAAFPETETLTRPLLTPTEPNPSPNPEPPSHPAPSK